MFFEVVSTALLRMVGKSSIPAPPFFMSQLNNLKIKLSNVHTDLQVGHRRHLFHLFSSFQTNIKIFTKNICEKNPSSEIRIHDVQTQRTFLMNWQSDAPIYDDSLINHSCIYPLNKLLILVSKIGLAL